MTDPTKQLTSGYKYQGRDGSWYCILATTHTEVACKAEVKNYLYTGPESIFDLDLTSALLWNPTLVPNPDWKEVYKWAIQQSVNAGQPFVGPGVVSTILGSGDPGDEQPDDGVVGLDTVHTFTPKVVECTCDSHHLATVGHEAGCLFTRKELL